MAAPVATRKVKRVSKNKKKSWRKHVNIEDVEDYLEDRRLQERTGGLVADKTDESLFYIEKTVPVAGEKKLHKGKKPLRCFQSLQSDTHIKPPKLARRECTKTSKQNNATDKRIRKLLDPKRKKNIELLKQAEQNQKTAKHYDLWGIEAEEIIFKKKNDIKGNVTLQTDEHFLRQTNKKGVKIPNTGTVTNKPSALPSVETPHPGASYNPSYDDHQKLLQMAVDKEKAKDKAEMKIYRALKAQFPKVGEEPTEASHLREMSAGIFDEDEEENQVISGGLSYNPPVRREDKKTITQRNKEKRQKEKLKKAQEEKNSKVKKKESSQLKSMKKEVRQREATLLERSSRRSVMKANKVYETKNLGKGKFEAPDLELKLSEDLKDSLRLLKPEGNLLSDRFKSLQKRNLIETRQKAKNKRKYKLKQYEKNTHKEVTL